MAQIASSKQGNYQSFWNGDTHHIYKTSQKLKNLDYLMEGVVSNSYR
jgi:hypothetical protein